MGLFSCGLSHGVGPICFGQTQAIEAQTIDSFGAADIIHRASSPALGEFLITPSRLRNVSREG